MSKGLGGTGKGQMAAGTCVRLRIYTECFIGAKPLTTEKDTG